MDRFSVFLLLLIVILIIYIIYGMWKKNKINEEKIHYLIMFFLIVFFAISVIWTFFVRNNQDIIFLNDYAWNVGNELSQYVTYDEKTIEINVPEGEDVDFATQQDVLKFNLNSLDFGVYNVHVEYEVYNNTSANTHVSFCSECHPNNFLFTNMKLNGYKSMQDSLVWVTSLRGISDLEMRINVEGYGSTSISAISIEEYFPWRIGVLLLESIVIVLYLIWRYVIKGWNSKRKLELFFIVGMIFFASLPMMTGHALVHTGHDYDFHLGRIASIANEIRYGHIPALYQSDALNGYGYASLLMYGNLFLYFPAFCHFLGLPLTCAYKFYVIIINAATVGIAYYSFSRIFRDKIWSILCVVLYVLAAYRITNIYIRTAVGEYTAMAFFPLVFYGLYRLYEEKQKIRYVDCIPLILGMSGIIQSHILSAEILALFIVLFGLAHFKASLRRVIPIIQSITSVLILNLFFIVPFLDIYAMDLQVKASESADLADRALTFAEAFNIFMPESGKAYPWTTQARMSLTIGTPLIIGFFLFIIVFIYRKTWVKNEEEKVKFKWVRELFAYTCLSLWMASQCFPWKDFGGKNYMIVKAFTSIQFPWRFLSIATLLMVPVTVYSCKIIIQNICTIGFKTKGTRVAFTVLVAINIMIIGHFFTDFMYVTPMDQTLCISSNISADGLYLLEGPFNKENIEVCSSSIQTTVRRAGTDVHNAKYYEVISNPEQAEIYLPVAYYNYLTIQDIDTKEYFKTLVGKESRLAFVAPAGYTGKVVVDYQFFTSWKICYLLSIAFGIGMIFYVIIQKRYHYREIGYRRNKE